MQVYILRHGAADERPGIADEERGLTEEGRRQIADVASCALGEGAAVSLALTSPLRRARETAGIAAAVWGGEPEFLETRALLPDAEPHEIWDEIRMHRDQPQVLLAAHEAGQPGARRCGPLQPAAARRPPVASYPRSRAVTKGLTSV
jgi:phosphohistidine phosphatase SixA